MEDLDGGDMRIKHITLKNFVTNKMGLVIERDIAWGRAMVSKVMTDHQQQGPRR